MDFAKLMERVAYVCAVAFVLSLIPYCRSGQPDVAPAPSVSASATRAPQVEPAYLSLSGDERNYASADYNDLQAAAGMPGYNEVRGKHFKMATLATLQWGRELAQTHCVGCHGAELGQARDMSTSPPTAPSGLHNDLGYYQHGSRGLAIFRTIKYGGPGPANDEEILAVAHYVRSLQAGNPTPQR
jgi:mono/diheme cytochrome c family protein